jgi:hypothetical protein
MDDTLDLVKSTECALGQAHGKVAENVRKEFKNVLKWNDGFSTMCKINGILSGNGATPGEENTALDSNDVTLFKYAPLTSCDVERGFSLYKTILSENRNSFSFENAPCDPLQCSQT